MLTLHTVFRAFGYAGLFLTAAWTFTQKRFDWLLYIGFTLLLVGVMYILIEDWRSGRKKAFWLKVGFAGLFMAICLF